jgi:crotonobetainyl-CoA:carnitine CoA-transferase CaiB-like acyl-CoA transferase
MSPPGSPSDRPLDGIRVLDLADEKGELAGRLLADMGADVIRVEPPTGAKSRGAPPFHDDKSLYFAFRNFNKRGLGLDLDSEPDRGRLRQLADEADVVIDSFGPGGLAARGLAPDSLVAANPGLVVLSISDFGATGPYRDWVATDATLEALGGMQFQAGLPEKAPLLPPGTPAWDIAGIMGAFAVLAALFQREKTGGHGQVIELSALEALAQQTNWAISNGSYTRAKGQDVHELRAGSGPMYKIYRCKTGYVRLVILSPRQWKAMREWLGDPEYLRDPIYDSFLGRMQIADAIAVTIGDLFETMGHEELAFEAQRRGIVCTPVLSPDEVLANEHFVSRGTFANEEYAPGATGPIAAGFFDVDGERQGYRHRAPEVGEHDAEILAGVWPRRERPSGEAPEPSLPFEGLRVIDFGIGGVGVEASRFFGQYGADVIKIESRSAPDFIRVVMSTEMSASFASSSCSKRAFGVNLKEPRGLELVHRLIEQADVVIENNSTGAMEKMGVGYETIRQLNPRIVMSSGQLLGSRGAWADWIGYGPSTQPVGGLVHLWNYDDQDDPAGSTSIFPDHLAGRVAALAAVAGLLRRERTGLGAHAELAQVETVTSLIGDLLLKTGLEPGSARPMGNRSERGAPWGSYPCLGEQQWVAITVRDDEDWHKLCLALGNPEWTAKPEYATAAGRRAAHDEIDEHLTAWTSTVSKNTVTQALQMFGVPAAPMLTGSEQITDPHFLARGYPRWVDQQDLAWIAFEGPCFRASGMSDVRVFQAPKVGEHTRRIAADLLGLPEAEVEQLVEAGTLEVPKDS